MDSRAKTFGDALLRLTLRMLPLLPGPEIYDFIRSVRRSQDDVDKQVQEAVDALSRSSRLSTISERPYTWTKTNMSPLRGWSKRGQRLRTKVPYGHWTTMTFLAALRHDRVEAPWLLKKPINGECFRLYVDKVLVPTLRPGDIVVLDNLGSHKSRMVRQAIRAAGAKLLVLPKYSPDLNPIEQLFAKLKHGLRKAAKRNFETVSDAIADVLDTVSPHECSNYLVNAGYAQR